MFCSILSSLKIKLKSLIANTINLYKLLGMEN